MTDEIESVIQSPVVNNVAVALRRSSIHVQAKRRQHFDNIFPDRYNPRSKFDGISLQIQRHNRTLGP
jgi:hypothetical protein